MKKIVLKIKRYLEICMKKSFGIKFSRQGVSISNVSTTNALSSFDFKGVIIITPFIMSFFINITWLQVITSIAFGIWIISWIVGYFYFAIKDPDRLQDETHIENKKHLDLEYENKKSSLVDVSPKEDNNIEEHSIN